MDLVIFDCDGTIVDSQNMIVAAMQAGFQAQGRKAPERAAILDIVGLSLPGAIERLLPESERAQAPALSEAYKAAFQALRRDPACHEPLYEGLRACIETLQARPDMVLGIATGKSKRGLVGVLERFALERHFVTLHTADDHPSKPHPAMIEAAMAATGADAARTVMVGDTTYDMEMARAAGVYAIGVTWGYHAPDKLGPAGAHAVVDTSHELLNAIDRFLGSSAG